MLKDAETILVSCLFHLDELSLGYLFYRQSDEEILRRLHSQV